MAKLTNCEISYERNTKIADYESKKFAARFSILIDDGEDPEEVTELYGRQIVRFVEDKLGIKSEITVPPVAKRPPVKEIAPPAPPAGQAHTGAASADGGPADAAPAPAQKKPGRPKKEAAPAPAASEDFPEETAAAEAGNTAHVITDDALRQAIQKHVAQHSDPVEVRQLVQTFFPKQANKVWGSTELPQDKRQAFLDKLAALNSTADI